MEIDQHAIEKVVIYKGPMSMQYGSDAIGGLIELLPGKPMKENSMVSDITFIGNSNNGLRGISAMIGFRRNNWGSKLRLTEKHFADYKIPTDTIVYLSRKLPVYNRKLKNTAGFERNISGSIQCSGKKINSLVSGSRIFQKTGFFPGSHGIPDLNRVKDDGNSRNIELPNSSVNHTKFVNRTQLTIQNLKAYLDLGFQINQRQEMAKFHTHYGNQLVPAINPDLEIDLKLKTFSGNIKFELDKGDRWVHTFGINSDFQHNQIAGYQFLLPEFEKSSAGLFAIENWKVSPKLTFSGGVRADFGHLRIQEFKDTILQEYLQNMAYQPDEISFYSQRSYKLNKTYSNFSWSAGIVFNPDQKQTIKINLGKSFRLPGANELASNGVHHGTFRHEQGDSSLVSERGYQFDMAYSFFNNRISFTINPFVGLFKNYIFLNPTGRWSVLPHAGQVYKYSQAKAFSGGGEISFNIEINKAFSYDSSLEYVYMQNLSDGYPLPFSPPTSVYNGIEWHFGHQNKRFVNSTIKIEQHLVSAQRRIARNEEITPGYQLFNLQVNSDLIIWKTNLKLVFQIHNIFDIRYYNHLSFYRKLNIPESGRAFQATIKIAV
jgi:iron complex outermembrane receptor protein